jgi:hypothetical protein
VVDLDGGDAGAGEGEKVGAIESTLLWSAFGREAETEVAGAQFDDASES